MDSVKKMVNVIKMFSSGFDYNLGPSKFHFCLGKQPKSAKRVELWEKKQFEMFPGMLPTTAKLTGFSKYFKTSKKLKLRKKRKTIGVQAEVKLIATNVYRSMLKKTLENRRKKLLK